MRILHPLDKPIRKISSAEQNFKIFRVLLRSAKISLFLPLLFGLALNPAASAAQTIATLPAGHFTVNITSGSGTGAATTLISLPLLSPMTGSGLLSGTVTAVTSNTLSNSSANWTSGSFAVAGSPYFVRCTSGVAAGHMFLVIGNTSTQLTLDTVGMNLTTLGIVTGTDTYEVFPGDTLFSVFGVPGPGNPVVGGSDPNGAVDRVYLMENGAWVPFYYNITANQWRRGSLTFSQNNKVVSPGAAILYSRVGTTPLSFILTGRVPETNYVIHTNTNGRIAAAAFFPVDQTLSSMAFQTIPGWKQAGIGGITSATADKVHIFESGAWAVYNYNGAASQWRRGTFTFSQNTKVIPAGTGVIVERKGSAGSASHTVTRPYPLQ